MSSFRYLVFLVLSGQVLGADGYVIGGGIESDTEDGLRVAAIGGLGVGESTWLSAGVSQSSVELPSGRNVDTLYADLELDHFFDPVGVRIGVSYWGDSDILDSNDWRASFYLRGAKASISAEYEFRDFDFTVPALDLMSVREFMFDADGLGLRASFDLTEDLSLALAGKKYDYSVDFVPDENRDVISLFTVSRLSLINSLIDSRASIEFALDRGLKRWELDFSTWEGEIDRSRTNSVTMRYMVPMTGKTDIEFGLGYDDSDVYGDVTFFSVYVYLYGSD